MASASLVTASTSRPLESFFVHPLVLAIFRRVPMRRRIFVLMMLTSVFMWGSSPGGGCGLVCATAQYLLPVAHARVDRCQFGKLDVGQARRGKVPLTCGNA